MENEKSAMDVDTAIDWVNERMLYGRYRPSIINPFVYDECCQAGDLAIKAMKACIDVQMFIQEKLDAGEYPTEETQEAVKEILGMLDIENTEGRED